jgi:hypothetical protein
MEAYAHSWKASRQILDASSWASCAFQTNRIYRSHHLALVEHHLALALYTSMCDTEILFS